MYYHYQKQKRATKCNDLGGFTRLVARAKHHVDVGPDEVPTLHVKGMSMAEVQKFSWYTVLNRPLSVLQWLASPEAQQRVTEDYVFIAETDHVFLRPIPNTATPEAPVAFHFGYMNPNPAFAPFIRRMWPEGGDQGYLTVQPIGPSPLIIHKAQLQRVAPEWNDLARKLKLDPEASKALGWVTEMWGYALAAAKAGITHTVNARFQTEAAHNSPGLTEHFTDGVDIFHFTYGIEYMMDGTPCPPWNIGQWSLDKRH